MRRKVSAARIEASLNRKTGLTAAQVEQQRARFGRNAILEAAGGSWSELVTDTVRDPMIWFLAGTASLFAWLGDRTEAIVLGLALIPIVGMDAFLHRRTQASTRGLAGRLASRARPIRDGRSVEIPAVDLVPGDRVEVAEGEAFPADCLILEGDGLQVDESALTGEAMPVRKRPLEGETSSPDEITVDGVSWGLAGTRLLTGKLQAVVAYTGADTLYGEIVRTTLAGRHAHTPLQQAIAALVRVLVVVSLLICIALALVRLHQGYGWIDALVSAVTLAVAALPEEFPVVFTFFLGVGVYRLAQRQALVRRAVVVENIGRVSCICTDKTGTLTEGRLELARIEPADGIDEERLLRCAALASRFESNDPLDRAVLERHGKVVSELLIRFPFTEDRRREMAVVRLPSGERHCAAKGAPETLLSISSLASQDLEEWKARTDALARDGFKVIGVGERPIPDGASVDDEPRMDFEFLGLLAFGDPVRPGVAEAVSAARAAGIRVIMLTGDHPSTAQAIATEIGLGDGTPHTIEGDALEALLASRDSEGLRRVDVIARAIPAQKLALVNALQDAGEIVAVTGDGVNDAPALQGADVGIAMGERGTRTAREVASIVLLDDNFRTIVRAIGEGRQLFFNLRLSFAYLLMIHIPLVISAALIPFAGLPLLYLPVHIVWLELIIHPTALLAYQKAAPEEGRLDRIDRTAGNRFFRSREWLLIAVVGLLITLVILFGYMRSLGSDGGVEHARAMAMVSLVVASATVTVGLSSGIGRVGAAILVAALLSALLLVQVPVLSRLLHLQPLHFDDWLLAAFGGLAAGALSSLMRVRKTAIGTQKAVPPNA